MFESIVRCMLSPSTQQCPSGMRIDLAVEGGNGVTTSPSSATMRFVVSSSGFSGDLELATEKTYLA